MFEFQIVHIPDVTYLKYIEYFNTFVKENKGNSPNTTIIDIRINNK